MDIEKYVQELIDAKSVQPHERTWLVAIGNHIYNQALEDAAENCEMDEHFEYKITKTDLLNLKKP